MYRLALHFGSLVFLLFLTANYTLIQTGVLLFVNLKCGVFIDRFLFWSLGGMQFDIFLAEKLSFLYRFLVN